MFRTVALAAATATAATMAFANVAGAVQVTLDNLTYDVSTVSGTYDGLVASALSQNPWFGNGSLATSAASQVGADLGLPNLGGIWGPYFTTGNSGNLVLGSFFDGSTILGSTSITTVDSLRTYAVATLAESEPVPEPVTILGTLVAIGLGSVMKRKRSFGPDH